MFRCGEDPTILLVCSPAGSDICLGFAQGGVPRMTYFGLWIKGGFRGCNAAAMLAMLFPFPTHEDEPLNSQADHRLFRI